jgi:UDP-N-acetylmuramate--alanine ligase
MENLLIRDSNIKTKKQIHLIGIGGSGMFPLAQILHDKGHKLTGSDNNETDTVAAVRNMGIKVHMGHRQACLDVFGDGSSVTAPDLIVRSAAIKDDNPEIITARERGIPVMERAELLGLITEQYNKAICVSGTHGKTTVSSMLTYIFMNAEEDISAVIGGKLKILDNGSARTGTSDIMICEACEYADTFLKLSPNISVILNINHDHLEYFKTMENLRLSFTKFCNITRDILVINADDENTMLAVKDSDFSGKIVTFGFSESNDYYPANINGNRFDLVKRGDFLAGIKLNVPGEHNILNAVAACAAAHNAKVSEASLVKGLESFTGAGRRFEIICCVNGVTVADDYAHHPTEITATLKAARSMDFTRVWAVHQPFTFSRTKTMLSEFARALSIADEITLTEIMAGRETDNHDICSADLVNCIKSLQTHTGCNLLGTFEEIAEYVCKNSKAGDLIITLGCGDVNKLSKMIAENLNKINNSFT